VLVATALILALVFMFFDLLLFEVVKLISDIGGDQ
jgi:hypothetical protein